MPLKQSFLLLFYLLLSLPISILGLPEPDPQTILVPLHSPPAVIPAFPEQSNLQDCPLNLPDELFHGVESACGAGSHTAGQLQKTRCCPVLAAWLYSAYAATALHSAAGGASPHEYDMPLLPDDSENCVEGLESRLRERGIELFKPNETCDLVYCYCEIRLHPLSCPEAFYVSKRGELVADKRVKRLERSCLNGGGNVDRFPGLGGCSQCLNSLQSLNSNKTSNSRESEERNTKMYNKDCQLMGLTWLLSKNRTAYIPTVSAVLRAMMMGTGGSNPQSCTLNSDGMPLAVDSTELSNNSESVTLQASIYASLALICLLHMLLVAPSIKFPSPS